LARDDAPKAAALQKEIQAHKEKTAKTNRKLARDIAKWVDTAMSTSAQPKAQASSSCGGDGDDDDLGVVGVGVEEDGVDDTKGPVKGRAADGTSSSK
jgi:hypothetical protein